MSARATDGVSKDQVVKEVEALIRLYDVRELQRLREQIEDRWWESGLRVLLFITGLGFIITVYELIPRQSAPLFWFVFGWVLLFILTLLGLIEYLIYKMRALCRLYALQLRLLDHLSQSLQREKSSAPTNTQE